MRIKELLWLKGSGRPKMQGESRNQQIETRTTHPYKAKLEAAATTHFSN